jgi:protein-tyrosine phosphatase
MKKRGSEGAKTAIAFVSDVEHSSFGFDSDFGFRTSGFGLRVSDFGFNACFPGLVMTTTAPNILLFLCTGNYYRSRYAEIYFNHRARAEMLNWHAISRGLATEKGVWNIGPISQHTLKRMRLRRIDCNSVERSPQQCSEADLAAAARIIALKEAEHRQMLEDRHPDWPDRVEYWHVHDLDLATADQALAEIEGLVEELLSDLAATQS